MKTTITVFLFLLYANFAIAQKEQLINDISAYIAEVDSLIKYGNNIVISHGHGTTRGTGIGAGRRVTAYFYSKNCPKGVLDIDNVLDDEFDWDEICIPILNRFVSFEVDTLTQTRKYFDTKKYFKNKKIIAIIETNLIKEMREFGIEVMEVDKIVRYISNDDIIFYEKTGNPRESVETIR